MSDFDVKLSDAVEETERFDVGNCAQLMLVYASANAWAAVLSAAAPVCMMHAASYNPPARPRASPKPPKLKAAATTAEAKATVFPVRPLLGFASYSAKLKASSASVRIFSIPLAAQNEPNHVRPRLRYESQFCSVFMVAHVCSAADK